MVIYVRDVDICSILHHSCIVVRGHGRRALIIFVITSLRRYAFFLTVNCSLAFSSFFVVCGFGFSCSAILLLRRLILSQLFTAGL